MLSPVVFIQMVLLCVSGIVGSLPTNTPVDQAAETVRVRNVLDQFFTAAKKRDWDAVAELMSSDFELYTDGASAFNKQAYVKVLKDDDMQVTDMELKDMEIRVSDRKSVV